MKKNTDFIYVLRFIAALFVVFSHYSPIRNSLINNGGEAVSFFFLLSGFILVIAYEKQITQNNLSVISFYVKRLARIYPLYLLSLLLTLSYHFFVHNNHSHLGLKLPFELFMVQTWFYPGSINYPDWSISCELFFYLLFPIYILKLKNVPINYALLMALTLIVFTVLMSYLLDGFSFLSLKTDLKGGYLYQHPIVRFPVFFLGNVLGFMYLKNIEIPKKYNILMLILGSVCIAFWTLKPVAYGLSIKQLGLLLIYTSLIFSLFQHESWANKYLVNKGFMLLGEISYGVYLLQFPVSSFVFSFTHKLSPINQFLLFLIVLVGFSYCTYEYFEKPFRAKIVSVYTHFSMVEKDILIQNTEGAVELKIKN
jgi:peptidoglycan/LPS O-acetylase OafA/YrhL